MQQANGVFQPDGSFHSAEQVRAYRAALQWVKIAAQLEKQVGSNCVYLYGPVLPENEARLNKSGLFGPFDAQSTNVVLEWRVYHTEQQHSGKLFIDAMQLREFSQYMAHQIFASGWKPDFLVGVWRGGCPVALYIHEYLKAMDWKVDHIALRTSLYEGVDRPGGEVHVHGEQYLVERLQPESRVLFCDDILESGRSMQAIYDTLQRKLKDRAPPLENFRIACLFTKSEKHQEGNPTPHWSMRDIGGDVWVVFPHELEELNDKELQCTLSPQVYETFKKDRASLLTQ